MTIPLFFQDDTPLGMIADDLTGACDTGAQFAARGLRTVVLLDAQATSDIAADLFVLSTDSRADTPEAAKEKTRHACRTLKQQGARLFYKKLDSTLKGNLGAEIEAILAEENPPFVLVAPAFPAMGRAVKSGSLHLHGSLLSPEVSLWARLQAQCALKVGHLDGSPAEPNVTDFRETLRKVAQTGCRCIGVDAVSDEDLAIIVEAALAMSPPPLLAGSAGLARQIAALLPEPAPKTLPHLPAVTGPVLLFLGSQNPITERQATRLMEDGRAERMPPEASFAATIEAALAAGHDLILPIHWTGDEAARLRELRPLLRTLPVSGLVLSGGDTAALVCAALDVWGIRLGGEVAPGMPWGFLLGGVLDGCSVCTKAGGFGDEAALCHAVAFLQGKER